jgi:hypothetical protein
VVHIELQDIPSGRCPCAPAPSRPSCSPDEIPAADGPAADPKWRSAGGGRVIVELPADIRVKRVNAGGLIEAAWAPAVALIVADMALVLWWDTPAVESLLEAHRDLASRRTELRLVIWSKDLHEAVRRRIAGARPMVYASVDAALRPHA